MDKIILEVRAGTGGEEASIFAAELMKMYKKYAERKGWGFSILDSHESSSNGIKSSTAEMSGEGVYNSLSQESGVHRVQRVPATERAGRVHTSTASVAVMPVVEPKEFDINPNDIEVSFFRSSGPGGQNVNKVETAVRILHKPTGVVVSCQEGRNQHGNREKAMEVLRSKLYEAQQEAQNKERGDLRRSQIGTGDRSEKIRTYNFPQDRITDHRIGKKWSHIESLVHDGDLDPIVKAFEKARLENN